MPRLIQRFGLVFQLQEPFLSTCELGVRSATANNMKKHFIKSRDIPICMYWEPVAADECRFKSSFARMIVVLARPNMIPVQPAWNTPRLYVNTKTRSGQQSKR